MRSFIYILMSIATLFSVSCVSSAINNPPTSTSASTQKQTSKHKTADKTYTVGGVTFGMIYVQGGTFTMGHKNDKIGPGEESTTLHNVTLDSYWIGQTEVTEGLWKAVMGRNPCLYRKGDKCPVEYVSWDDCIAFINKLNDLTGEIFRLPTEAEWEFAACGGNQSHGYRYSGSNNIDDVGWYSLNSGKYTKMQQKHPVAKKQPNELGIYDMSGNVWEWCHDWASEYTSSSQTNPTGPSSGEERILRGGGFLYIDGACSVSNRSSQPPSRRDYNLGLRLAR